MHAFKVALTAALAAVSVPAGLWLAGATLLVFSGAAPAGDTTLLTFVSYAYWYASHPAIGDSLYASGLLGALVALAPALVWLKKPAESLHGDARWATRTEIRKAGLLAEEGIIVAALGKRLLRHSAPGAVSPHVYLAAPTGSGKTQGVMLPNALAWPGSLVALDIKGELFERTAGFRAAHGQKVFRLNFTPRDYRTHQYNPFAFVSEDPNFLVADVHRITNYLIQLGKGDDFWPQEARRMVIAIALYLHGIGETPTLPRIRAIALLGDDGSGFQAWCRSVAASTELRAKLHPEAYLSLANFGTSAENTVAGIVQTASAGLTPFLNDLTATVVSGNSFDLRKLREEATSIYLVVQPAELEQLGPVVRLFWQQLVDLNSDCNFGDSPHHRYLVLLGMDEFATIGRVPAIQQSVAYIRSYGLRLLAIVQSDAQVEALYERAGGKAFLDNFGCAIFYTPAAKDLAGAETISRLLGNKTVKARSRSQRSATLGPANRSHTESDQRRPLMLAQEVLRLPVEEAIVLVSGTYPMRVRKPFAAKDRRFLERTGEPPEIPCIEVSTERTRTGAATAQKPSAPPSGPVAPAGAPAGEARAAPAGEPQTCTLEPGLVESLGALQLSDFSLDLSGVALPKRQASQEEIDALCNNLLDQLFVKPDAREDER